MSGGGRLLLDGNPKGGEVEERIAIKVEGNPRMISALKNERYI